MDTSNSTKELQEKLSNQPHYTQFKIQPLDFIFRNQLDFCTGNVIKYVMRHSRKNGREDLIKARVYLDKLISEYVTDEPEAVVNDTLIASIPKCY